MRIDRREKKRESLKREEVAMSDFSKNRVLALYKILIKNTDEQHPIAGNSLFIWIF